MKRIIAACSLFNERCYKSAHVNDIENICDSVSISIAGIIGFYPSDDGICAVYQISHIDRIIVVEVTVQINRNGSGSSCASCIIGFG